MITEKLPGLPELVLKFRRSLHRVSGLDKFRLILKMRVVFGCQAMGQNVIRMVHNTRKTVKRSFSYQRNPCCQPIKNVTYHHSPPSVKPGMTRSCAWKALEAAEDVTDVYLTVFSFAKAKWFVRPCGT
jgi:hypothetical protein